MEKRKPSKIQVKKTKNKLITFGIQGGKGSFNEQALMDYVTRHNIVNYKIKYLYTTEKVFHNLDKGRIDYGQFAIHNSVGGMVGESIKAIARYKFKIIEEFAIKIRHFLMKRKDAQLKDIKVVMTHDQVFRQCNNTLQAEYPNLKRELGHGDYMDHAKIAWGIANNKLDKNIAVMGPEVLSKLYNFDIIDFDLQDNKENYTSFLMVKGVK